MSEKEFAMIAMALKTYFPRENILPNDKAMDLWYEQLKDIPYQVVETVLKKWVSLNKWSPSIADIREMASEITQGVIPDWGEAWLEVQKAVRYYGSYRADEAMDSLSPLARQATERIGFMNLCMSENPDASRANFRMIYESLSERAKKEAQIPQTLKELITNIKLLEGGNEKNN